MLIFFITAKAGSLRNITFTDDYLRREYDI